MKKNTAFKSTFGERFVFGLYGSGINVFFVLIGTYLQQYYLVEAAVPAAALGMVFLIVKIWDGINDPIFGVIVDKMRFKRGKYLPWMRVATFLLPLTAALMFFVPKDFPVSAKLVFLLITYILYDSSDTMTEVPFFALTTAMTDIPRERSHIITMQKIIALLPALVVLFLPSMYEKIGWQPTIVIFAAYSMLVMLPGCFKLKERVRPVSDNPPTLRQLFSFMKGNKFLIIYFISAILYGITNTPSGVATLFCKYNLGDEGLIAPLLIAAFVPSFLAILLVKGMIGRIDKIPMVICAHIVTVVSSILLYLVGYENLAPLIVLTIIRGFSTGAHTALFFLFAPDFAEYGAYKSGINAEGLSFSMQSLSSKLISALAGAFGLFMLAGFGFVEGSDVQPESGMQGIWLLTTLIPIIGCVLQTVVLVLWYKLRDWQVDIMSKYNHGEITREEADKLLRRNNEEE
ncbi:MAG: MFS transporter [Clostridiales Family XIII bacterium]|jgi:probable glucitol transport protein GutA|nr:MFS transporter [Clostridiales Family XIII bacterium]